MLAQLSPQAVTLVVVAAVLISLLISGIHVIPNDRIGVVEKRWSSRGSVEGGFLALAGEAGFLPEVLRGGIHFRFPLQYRVIKAPLVTIPQGKIGYVFARDGAPLGPMQTLASNRDAQDFQNAREFLRVGGQKGPQRLVLRSGTYAINLAQFVVLTEAQSFFIPLNSDDERTFRNMSQTIFDRQGFDPIVIKGGDDLLGVVIVHDGPSLPQGEIIAPVVGDENQASSFHNNFQDPEAFLSAGGHRGRQLQVLVEGTYFINRLFATVEPIAKTVVDVGYVGVVVSYVGKRGLDVSGNEYSHGELVAAGHRGVLAEPLLPGKYAFNTFAGKVILVPTTNFILKWNRAQIGAHKLDENLSEISLITKDAFEPNLPLSVVVHIDYRQAPLVVQRFGDVKKLVEQMLDPMIAAYFKNVGQTRTLIELIQDRSAIQSDATGEMRVRFGRYNLELEEVLIGTPASGAGDTHIEQVLEQLRSRQIAAEQIETYARQEKASVKERELREAEARARTQASLTASELSIQIESNAGKAAYEKSIQEALRIRKLAEAEAERTACLGLAEALAIEEQVRAYGGPRFQVTREVMKQFAEAVEKTKIDVVPKMVVGTNGTGGLLDSLLAMTLGDKLMGGEAEARAPRSAEAEALRGELFRALGTKPMPEARGEGGALAQGTERRCVAEKVG